MMLLVGLGGALVGAVVGGFSVLVAGRARTRRHGLAPRVGRDQPARRVDWYVDVT